MKILIFGGSGQLGKSLLACEWDPHQILAPSSTEVNINNLLETKNLICELAPDFVVNSSAWTDVPLAETDSASAFKLNADAVGNLAAACIQVNAPLVHISTDYVFDGSKSEPYLEEDKTSPLNKYGESKLAGENAILNSGLKRYYIIRTSWLYSKYGKNFVKTITSKALNGEKASITDDQFGSPTYAADLATAIQATIFSNPASGIYHYSNSGVTNWFEFGKRIYELSGAHTSLVSGKSTNADELKRPAYSPLDLTKWNRAGLPKARDWESALSEAMPDIIRELNSAEE